MNDAYGQHVRILLVGGDLATQTLIADYLHEQAIEASMATTRQEMAEQFDRHKPNLVILDMHLDQDGNFDLLREIRSRFDVPVIIVTGHRCGEADRVSGLEVGADDYVTKPFGQRELLARIHAVWRRWKVRFKAVADDHEMGYLRFGEWQVDPHHQRVIRPDGTSVALGKGEYALLLAFLRAPQRPLTRVHLVQATHIHEDILDRSIDVQILRLRRKIERDPQAPPVIQTRRGIGYIFSLPVEEI